MQTGIKKPMKYNASVQIVTGGRVSIIKNIVLLKSLFVQISLAWLKKVCLGTRRKQNA
jgi:hypothetical protein